MHNLPQQHARSVLEELLSRPERLVAAGATLGPDRGDRCWTKLSEDERHDAWLIAWGRNSGLAAHDHGLSHATVYVLTGSLIERHRTGSDHSPWTVRLLRAGSSIAVPGGRVHEVHNPYRDTALSVHVYSPPLRVMNTHATDLAAVGA